MKKAIFTAILAAFSLSMSAQSVSSYAVSDSIWKRLDLIGYDSTIQITESFYDESEVLYTAVFQIPGAGYKALSSDGPPRFFPWASPALVRAWINPKEISVWVQGVFGDNFQGLYINTIPTGYSARIAISGVYWYGYASTTIDATARAFLALLLDPNFNSYKP